MSIEPFTIAIDDGLIEDLRRRLHATRWPDQVKDSGWKYGADLEYMRDICSYWADDFDWRKQEAILNGFPQFRATIDGLNVHFIHVRSQGPKPIPLLISHGWPSSFAEMYRVIGPLSDPASFGGDPQDSFDVIVPSLVGAGFSDIAPRPFGAPEIAETWGALMGELGYDRFGLQGGDWGAAISGLIAWRLPDRCLGLHLNMSALRPSGDDALPQTAEEEAFLKDDTEWGREETGYQAINGTRPQTLAYGLSDSPSGLAAWIIQKWRALADCGGDVESAFTRDELLTNVSIYWFTNTINSMNRLYYEARHSPWRLQPGERVQPPTGFAMFPKEVVRAPRTFVDRAYANITRWTEFDRGGHFPNLENPEAQVEDVRAFFRPLR